jgi:hypothetical protein
VRISGACSPFSDAPAFVVGVEVELRRRADCHGSNSIGRTMKNCADGFYGATDGDVSIADRWNTFMFITNNIGATRETIRRRISLRCVTIVTNWFIDTTMTTIISTTRAHLLRRTRL